MMRARVFLAFLALGAAAPRARAQVPASSLVGRWTWEALVDTEAVADGTDRKSTRLNSSHIQKSRMPSSA